MTEFKSFYFFRSPLIYFDSFITHRHIFFSNKRTMNESFVSSDHGNNATRIESAVAKAISFLIVMEFHQFGKKRDHSIRMLFFFSSSQ